MRIAFADTGYWVALLNPRDALHQDARSATRRLGIEHLITTDEVLVEVLAFFCAYGAAMRRSTVRLVRQLLHDPRVEVLPQTHASFLDGLAFYAGREDKEYSLVDCGSMRAMRPRHLAEAPTPHHPVEQAG